MSVAEVTTEHRIFHDNLKENDFEFYVVIKSL